MDVSGEMCFLLANLEVLCKQNIVFFPFEGKVPLRSRDFWA